jgi:hypothetical protein
MSEVAITRSVPGNRPPTVIVEADFASSQMSRPFRCVTPNWSEPTSPSSSRGRVRKQQSSFTHR